MMTTVRILCRLALFSLLCSAAPCPGNEPLEVGTCRFEWTEPGERFDLWAVEAPLDAVIRDLAKLHGAEVSVQVDPPVRRTVRMFDVTLEEFLHRVGVDYRLRYVRGEEGRFRLAGGGVGTSDSTASLASTPLPVGPEAEGIRRLLRDLRDDDVRFNYRDAISDLIMHTNKPLVTRFMMRALDSDDAQQRRGARGVLANYAMDKWDPDLSWQESFPLLQEIRFEALRDDAMVEATGGDERISSRARRAVLFYARHPEVVAEEAASFGQALYSNDRQLRFLSAALLGGAGHTQYASRIVDVLTPQLLDNDTRQDSLLAVYGLVGLGADVAELPLSVFETRADRQARNKIKRIRKIWRAGEWEDRDDYIRLHHSWNQDSFAPLR